MTIRTEMEAAKGLQRIGYLTIHKKVISGDHSVSPIFPFLGTQLTWTSKAPVIEWSQMTSSETKTNKQKKTQKSRPIQHI